MVNLPFDVQRVGTSLEVFKTKYKDAQNLWSELHPKPPENNADLKGPHRL